MSGLLLRIFMIRQGNVTVTDLTITPLPAAPLYALEIWTNPAAVANRFKAATGFALPPMGRSAGNGAFCLIRYEPSVWLIEGDASALPALLKDDGTITAIGGGIVRLRLSGNGWRTLLMEGGMFDAETPDFAPACSAATIIDNVAVRLHVVSDDSCDAYVPASYSESLLHFWLQTAQTLSV